MWLDFRPKIKDSDHLLKNTILSKTVGKELRKCQQIELELGSAHLMMNSSLHLEARIQKLLISMWLNLTKFPQTVGDKLKFPQTANGLEHISVWELK